MRQSTKIILASGLASLAMACAGTPKWSPETAYGDEPARLADFLAARYAGLTDDPAGAARFYRRAYEREPVDAELLERAVVASLLAGDTGGAAQMASSAADPVLAQAPFASLTRVADDISRGRTRQALQRIDRGGLGAANMDLSRYLGAWLESSSNLDHAMARLQSDTRQRIQGESNAVAGLILAARARPEEARARLELAWSSRIRDPDATATLIKLTQDPVRAADIVDQYRIVAGYDPVIESLAVDPATGRRPAARAELSPSSALRMSGRSLMSRSNPELASIYLALASHIDPGNDGVRVDLAEALRQLGRPSQALAALEGVDAASPYRPRALMLAALSHEDLGENDQALASADAALAIARPRALLVQAGDLNRSLGRHSDAERYYDEAARLDAGQSREDWRLLFARAVERDRLGRWPEAEADLKRALELEPDRPELLNFLGYGWVERGGNVREGLALIERALAARPDQGYIVDSLGWAHYRLGDYDEAVIQLERAAELSPSDASINDHLGDAYWRSNRQREAEYQWRRALTQGPSPDLETQLRAKLASGLAPVDAPRAVAGGAARPRVEQ
jgi:tetratricopeptide (TPR) repeat protein